MTYALFCAAVCLAVFSLVTAVGSAAIAAGTPLLRRILSPLSPGRRAEAQFAVAMSPFLAGLAAALGVALPAFLLFEPPWSGEPVGMQLPLLAAAGFAWIAFAMIRGARLQWQTARAQREWRRHVVAEVAGVCELEGTGPLLGTVGVVRPQVYAARELLAKLSAAELEATLAHETGHIRAADNLKRLLLSAAPGSSYLRALRADWARSAEVAADEAAVESGACALDLASALVKVGRMRAPGAHPALASHLIPPGAESQVGDRVRYLTAVLNGAQRRQHSSLRWMWWSAVAAGAAYAVFFMPLMRSAHEMIERLVR